jgi:hypothetical protein
VIGLETIDVAPPFWYAEIDSAYANISPVSMIRMLTNMFHTEILISRRNLNTAFLREARCLDSIEQVCCDQSLCEAVKARDMLGPARSRLPLLGIFGLIQIVETLT